MPNRRGDIVNGPVTQGQFFETMRALREDVDRRHRTLREDIQVGFRDLRESFDEHAAEDRKLADRLLRIEVERDGEKQVSVRRGTWAGILGGSVVAAAVKWAERLFTR